METSEPFSVERIAAVFGLTAAEVEAFASETGYTAAREEAAKVEAEFHRRLKEHVAAIEILLGSGLQFDTAPILGDPELE